MSRTNGSNVDHVNERIDFVADLLMAGKKKSDIKNLVKEKFGSKFRTVERDIMRAKERLLFESMHVEFAVGLVNCLHGQERVCRQLAEEKGVKSKRSAQRIYEAAVIQRDGSAKVAASEMKAQITEALKQIIRDTKEERTRLLAIQQLSSLLGLDRIKIDMTVNEESEIKDLANSIIADLRRRGKDGKRTHQKLVEMNRSGRHNGNGHA